ncbi:hypothetical protein TRVA0_007S00210 [Trichomonascus vanleenenianus]|uniref:Zn(II)2Cys6 transcription factor n=1 Tax=Trichomonascus vanleenenianus TaxID=2268995 RepID=UPI003EC9E908
MTLTSCDACKLSKTRCVISKGPCERCSKRRCPCLFNGKSRAVAEIDAFLSSNSGYAQWLAQSPKTTAVHADLGFSSVEFVKVYQASDDLRASWNPTGELQLSRAMKTVFWNALCSGILVHLPIVSEKMLASGSVLLQAAVYATAARTSDIVHSLLDFKHLREIIKQELIKSGSEPIVSFEAIVSLVLCHSVLEVHSDDFESFDVFIFNYVMMARGCLQLKMNRSNENAGIQALFYSIYIADRWMSTLLGSPVIIRDADVTTQIPLNASPFFIAMVTVSSLLGRVRAQFYSVYGKAACQPAQADALWQTLEQCTFPDILTDEENYFIRVHLDTVKALFLRAARAQEPPLLPRFVGNANYDKLVVHNAFYALTRWTTSIFYSPCIIFSTIYYCLARALIVMVESPCIEEYREAAKNVLKSAESLLSHLDQLDDGLFSYRVLHCVNMRHILQIASKRLYENPMFEMSWPANGDIIF